MTDAGRAARYSAQLFIDKLRSRLDAGEQLSRHEITDALSSCDSVDESLLLAIWLLERTQEASLAFRRRLTRRQTRVGHLLEGIRGVGPRRADAILVGTGVDRDQLLDELRPRDASVLRRAVAEYRLCRHDRRRSHEVNDPEMLPTPGSWSREDALGILLFRHIEAVSTSAPLRPLKRWLTVWTWTPDFFPTRFDWTDYVRRRDALGELTIREEHYESALPVGVFDLDRVSRFDPLSGVVRLVDRPWIVADCPLGRHFSDGDALAVRTSAVAWDPKLTWPPSYWERRR